MEDALLNIGTKYSDQYVNQLAKKQIELTEVVQILVFNFLLLIGLIVL